MNPFRLNYKKREDKVTSLFIHILEQCDLKTEFLQNSMEPEKRFL